VLTPSNSVPGDLTSIPFLWVNDVGKDRDFGEVKQDEWWDSYYPAQGRNMKEREARVFKDMGPAVRILVSQR
jgi:hypothetical protein